MKNIFFLLILVYSNIYPQQIKILFTGTSTSIRGLSAVNDRVVWVSGSDGMVGKSLDSGLTWNWMRVKGFEKTDFRDIEAFNESVAVIMGIDEPAYILRTMDGGETWKIVYENKIFNEGIDIQFDCRTFTNGFYIVYLEIDGKIYSGEFLK